MPEWRPLSPDGDRNLIDGSDIAVLAKATGLRCTIPLSVVGPQDEVARIMSRVAWEAAAIGRTFSRPVAKDDKIEWGKRAKLAAELGDALGQSEVQRLCAQAARDAGIPSNLYDQLEKLPALLKNLGKLAQMLATQKQPSHRPRDMSGNWLMAGIAAAYEKIAGKPPRRDSPTGLFAKKALTLVVQRMDGRWLPGELARLHADPGVIAIRTLAGGVEKTLAGRMVAGWSLWTASNGELSFGFGDNCP